MHTKDAVRILRNRGYDVEVVNRKLFLVSSKGHVERYTGRELVNFARIWTSEGQRLPIKGNLKDNDHRLNRAATREKLHHEDYDAIPRGGKVKCDDIWNWD